MAVSTQWIKLEYKLDEWKVKPNLLATLKRHISTKMTTTFKNNRIEINTLAFHELSQRTSLQYATVHSFEILFTWPRI